MHKALIAQRSMFDQAKLLWDSIRVLTPLMIRCRKLLPEADFGFANRTQRSKKPCYKITMAKGTQVPKKRRKQYRRLLKVTNEVFDMYQMNL